MVLFWQ